MTSRAARRLLAEAALSGQSRGQEVQSDRALWWMPMNNRQLATSRPAWTRAVRELTAQPAPRGHAAAPAAGRRRSADRPRSGRHVPGTGPWPAPDVEPGRTCWAKHLTTDARRRACSTRPQDGPAGVAGDHPKAGVGPTNSPTPIIPSGALIIMSPRTYCTGTAQPDDAQFRGPEDPAHRIRAVQPVRGLMHQARDITGRADHPGPPAGRRPFRATRQARMKPVTLRPVGGIPLRASAAA